MLMYRLEPSDSFNLKFRIAHVIFLGVLRKRNSTSPRNEQDVVVTSRTVDTEEN